MRNHGVNRLLASYSAWQERTSGPLWSWQEIRLLDQYARALVHGAYRSTRPAAVACIAALDALRAKHPEAAWAVAPRPLMAVRVRINHRASDMGGRWSSSHWFPRERRIAERHAQRFLGGRCPSIKQAARDCKADLDRLYGSPDSKAGLVSHRPFYGVYTAILDIVRGTGWSKPDGYWSAQEKRITAKYARKVVERRYPSAGAAARACQQEFDRLRLRRPAPAWLAQRRRLLGIKRTICDQARATGKFGRNPLWTGPELREADRYARAVVAGRYTDARSAALACRREAGGVMKRRSLVAIHWKICERARQFGRPSDKWTSDELRLLGRCARGLSAGRFGSLVEAAQAYQLEATQSRGWRLGPRSRQAVISRLQKQTTVRGHRSRQVWSRAEESVRDKWVRWYGRRRLAGQSRMLGRAATGLMGDLERLGSARTRAACLHQLTHRLQRNDER